MVYRKGTRNMKMFIWIDPHPVSYGQSRLTVVAKSVEQARELEKTGSICTFGTPDFSDPMPMNADDLGEPTRVFDLPCAEWDWWSE